ncbi:ROK family protein [Microbacterium gorillae]|uniref:ROK family protein n=1 Tax=Microbacterium gorillae TaxID=1231063 RepID=UPI000694A151|nr:ROK family protein [Microbacterium gorillae]
MELAIDFGGTEVKIGLIEAGEFIRTFAIPAETGSRDVLERAAAAVADVAGVSAVGIAVPGVLAPGGRAMLAANDKYEPLVGVDLIDWAGATFGLPAVVENDARAALLGELAPGGCADGVRDAVLLTLGTGIGTAAVMGGVPIRGAHGHAGILGGHVTVDIDGPPCPCGNIGCAEQLASSRTLREAGIGPEQWASAAAGTATLAVRRAIEAHLRVWGAVAVTMCHMYDPDVVVLTGGILRAGDIVREGIERWLDAHLWSTAHRPEVRVPSAPEHSVLRGLAVLAADVEGKS